MIQEPERTHECGHACRARAWCEVSPQPDACLRDHGLMAAAWRPTRRRAVTSILAAAVALAGCGAAAPAGRPAASATPSVVLTEVDSGRTVQLRVGDEAVLRLSSQNTWAEPQVNGGAVRVTRVDAVRDSGFREWRIEAVTAGTATVRSFGRPPCTPGQICPALVVAFSVTIVVA